jgi:hypothetical protein
MAAPRGRGAAWAALCVLLLCQVRLSLAGDATLDGTSDVRESADEFLQEGNASSTSSGGAGPGGKPFSIIPGLAIMTDGMLSKGVTKADCQAKCSQDATCQSFSWSLQSKEGKRVNDCYTSKASLTYSEEFTTKVKSHRFARTGRWNTLPGMTLHSPDAWTRHRDNKTDAKCAEECAEEEPCKAFSYRHNDNLCLTTSVDIMYSDRFTYYEKTKANFTMPWRLSAKEQAVHIAKQTNERKATMVASILAAKKLKKGGGSEVALSAFTTLPSAAEILSSESMLTTPSIAIAIKQPEYLERLCQRMHDLMLGDCTKPWQTLPAEQKGTWADKAQYTSVRDRCDRVCFRAATIGAMSEANRNATLAAMPADLQSKTLTAKERADAVNDLPPQLRKTAIDAMDPDTRKATVAAMNPMKALSAMSTYEREHALAAMPKETKLMVKAALKAQKPQVDDPRKSVKTVIQIGGVAQSDFEHASVLTAYRAAVGKVTAVPTEDVTVNKVDMPTSAALGGHVQVATSIMFPDGKKATAGAHTLHENINLGGFAKTLVEEESKVGMTFKNLNVSLTKSEFSDTSNDQEEMEAAIRSSVVASSPDAELKAVNCPEAIALEIKTKAAEKKSEKESKKAKEMTAKANGDVSKMKEAEQKKIAGLNEAEVKKLKADEGKARSEAEKKLAVKQRQELMAFQTAETKTKMKQKLAAAERAEKRGAGASNDVVDRANQQGKDALMKGGKDAEMAVKTLKAGTKEGRAKAEEKKAAEAVQKSKIFGTKEEKKVKSDISKEKAEKKKMDDQLASKKSKSEAMKKKELADAKSKAAREAKVISDVEPPCVFVTR